MFHLLNRRLVAQCKESGPETVLLSFVVRKIKVVLVIKGGYFLSITYLSSFTVQDFCYVNIDIFHHGRNK